MATHAGQTQECFQRKFSGLPDCSLEWVEGEEQIILSFLKVLLTVHLDNLCNENQLDALCILNP
jgi:hypothetical protein